MGVFAPSESGQQIAGRNRYWRAWVNVEWVQDVSDTCRRIRVRATMADRTAALYGVHYDVLVNGQVLASRDVVLNNYGGWADRDEAYVTYDAPRGASAWTCPVQVHAYGKVVNGYGSAGGDCWATINVTVPQRGYSKPNPPKSCSLTRVSDTSHRLAWTGDYTGMDGARPWAGIYVDRRTDDGSWVNIADLSWSATSYSDNSTKAGHKYEWRLCAHGPGGNSDHASCGTSFTTPAAPSRVSAAKSGASSVTLEVAGAWAYATSWEAQRSADGGKTWEACEVAASGTGSSSVTLADASAPAGTVTYRVRAVRGPLASAWVQSNSVTTITPPLAPAVSVPAVAATGEGVTVAWSRNHPDGSAQAAAQVEISGDETLTYDVADGSSLGLTPAKGSWKVRVRTKGLHADWGEWSGYAPLTVADPPQCWVSHPSQDGQVVGSVPLAVGLHASDETGIAQATLTLSRADGTVVATYDVTGLDSVDVGSYETMSNASAYVLSLSVRGGSSLTAEATRRIATQWATPATPVVDVSYDEAYAAHVTVRNGVSNYEVVGTALTGPMAYDESTNTIRALGTVTAEDGAITLGDAARCSSFTVERVLADGDHVVAAGLLDSQEGVDPLPPLNTAYQYRVTGIAESGVASQATAEARVEADGGILNFGDDAGEAMRLDYDLTWDTSAARATERSHFADGGERGHMPVSYALDELDVKTGASFSLTRAGHDSFRDLMRRRWLGWLRTPGGERAFGAMTFGDSLKACDLWTGSVSVTHDAFEEASNG